MEAKLYNLASTRSARNLATSLDKIYQTQLALAGWALTKSATLFWAEFARGLVSYHATVMSAAFSPYLKPPKIAVPPQRW